MPKGVYQRTQENRQHLSESMMGKNKGNKKPPRTKEHREKLSEAQKHLWTISEYREKTTAKLKEVNSSLELRARISAKLKGRKLSDEVRLHMSIAQKNRPPFTPEHRHNLSVALKGRRPSEKAILRTIETKTGKPTSDRQKQVTSETHKRLWADPEHRAMRQARMKEVCNSAAFKEKSSRNSKARWANPEYKMRVIRAIVKGANFKPNVPEKFLMSLLSEIYPKEYKYTGDGSVIIGGKIPDFTNINGKKKLIEVFGDYFHNPKKFKNLQQHRTEKGTIALYKQYGWDCLVIWEHELEQEKIPVLIKRIRDFDNAPRR